jgi:hypothetical protein
MAFIGQAIGFGLGLGVGDLTMIATAALIAWVAATGLRVLGGASERDADALSRCRDFRRILAARLRRYHDALHQDGDAALSRVIPKTGELSTAWAALDALVRDEFTRTELIAGFLRAEIKRLYALLQTVLAIGDALAELPQPAASIRDRAAIGLVLHTLRRLVLEENAPDRDPVLGAELDRRCDRLVERAVAAPGVAVDMHIALLRVGLATRHGTQPEIAPETSPTAAPQPQARLAGACLLPTTRIAIQAGLSALAIIAANAVLGMDHMLWALAASTYVISSSVADTWSRGLRRIVGTAVGVAFGLAIALLFAHVPLIVWVMAALAMVVYSTWLPLRYDVACGAYAFALVVTLAEAGHSSWNAASARGLDTVIGAAIGMTFSALILPVRLRDQLAETLAVLLTEARDHAQAALAWAEAPVGAPDRAVAGAVTSADLLAEFEAQKARFAGLRVEGVLARDGDGGALLLLRIDALIETTMRLVGEARLAEDRLAEDRVEAAMRQTIAGLSSQLRLAFDAVLTRLRRGGRPALPAPDSVLPPLHAYMARPGVERDAAAGVLLAAALTYTCRKTIGTLAELAAELDRRDGAAA